MQTLERNPHYPKAFQEDIIALGKIALVEAPRIETPEQAQAFLSENNIFQVLHGAISRHAEDGRQIKASVGSFYEPLSGHVAFHFHAFNAGEDALTIGAQRDSMSGLTTYSYMLSLDNDPSASGNLERGSGLHANSFKLSRFDDPLINGELLPLLVKDAAFDLIGALQHQQAQQGSGS